MMNQGNSPVQAHETSSCSKVHVPWMSFTSNVPDISNKNVKLYEGLDMALWCFLSSSNRKTGMWDMDSRHNSLPFSTQTTCPARSGRSYRERQPTCVCDLTMANSVCFSGVCGFNGFACVSFRSLCCFRKVYIDGPNQIFEPIRVETKHYQNARALSLPFSQCSRSSVVSGLPLVLWEKN